MATPFFWQGNTGEILTPEQVKRQRLVAESLAAKAAPTTFGAGLSRVGDALQYNAIGARTAEAEKLGLDSATQAFSGLADGSGSNAEIIAALSNPWVAENPAQSGIAQALLQQNMKRDDPMTALDMQLKQAQLAAASQPEQQSLINTANGIYDPNNASWIQPPGAGEAGAPPPNVEGEGKLRTEYGNTNTVKDYGLQTQAYQRVLDSASSPSAAGDLSLIFNYMKVLDPGSTVREGEFATAAATGSFGDQLQAAGERILSGQRLTPEQRMDFVNRAGQLFQGATELQEKTNARYQGLATQYGYDPERITAPIPLIGVLDPNFNIEEYVTPEGEQIKPLPVTNDAEYEALPSGATFIAPDGSIRKKP
jgi:hypothetical protein